MSTFIPQPVLGDVPAVKLPVLIGARVRVRPATVADAGDWFAIRAEAGPGQSPMPAVAEAEARLAEMVARPAGQPGWRQWMVEDPAGRPIGDLGLRWPSIGAPAEIGFEMLRRARGAGLGTEAVGLLCDWALGPAGFSLLAAVTQKVNASACALLDRSGFIRIEEGDLFEILEVAGSELLYARRRADA